MQQTQEPAEEEEYLLGTNDEEVVRLGFQHQVWSGYAAAGWERAGFGPGQELLDVGCGPGYATFDLARLAGDAGRVLGIDLSPRFVRFLSEQAAARGITNVAAEVHDVEQLQLPPERFDGAYARWVLCFLADPESAVAGVTRALRPGASFVVQDYAHYLGVAVAPQSEAFRRVFEAVVRSWRERGGDPDLGTRLPGMMQRCGLQVTSIRPIVRIARPRSALWKWPETFFTGFIPSLVESGALAQAEADAFWREWRQRSDDGGAFFLSPPMVEVIGTKM